MRYDINLNQVITWQRENSPNIKFIISLFDELHREINAKFWDSWERDVVNIDTANEFGLDMWARILNVDTGYSTEPQPEKNAFGFGRNRKNFDKPANFGLRSGAYRQYTAEQKRLLIRLRVFALTKSPTQYNINEFLRKYLWRDDMRVYVKDSFDMQTILYVFTKAPSEDVLFLLDRKDILPRPSTVYATYLIQPKNSFGFGKLRHNFNKPSNFGEIKWQ